jgi:hypothetical protein
LTDIMEASWREEGILISSSSVYSSNDKRGSVFLSNMSILVLEFLLKVFCKLTLDSHFMNDVVQVDGQSHVVHSEEEAVGTRLTIDSLTCLLANESDPSRLTALSPGKLMRFLLEDGSHVSEGQPYAEVEV